MADNMFDPENYIGLVRDALDDDIKVWNKRVVGQEEPGFMDYLLPQGRFQEARRTRDAIRAQVALQALNQMQGPTAGDFATMYPGSVNRLPSAAFGTQVTDNPIGPVPVEGLDRMVGTQTDNIPIKSPQQVMSPFAQYSSVGNADVGMTATKLDQATHRPVTTGVYAPEEVPMVERKTERVLNPNYRLPNTYSNLLKEMQDAESKRAGQPHYPSWGEQAGMLRLTSELNAFKEQHGRPPTAVEYNEIVTRATEGFQKPADPSTPEGRIAGHTEKIKGAEANVAPDVEAAKLQKVRADIRLTDAQAAEHEQLLSHKIDNIISEIEKRKFDMSKAQQKAAAQQLALDLNIAGHAMKYLKWVNANDSITQEGKIELQKNIIDKIMPWLELEEEDRSGTFLGGVQDFLGVDKNVTIHKKGETSAPKLTPPPTGESKEKKPKRDFSGAPKGKSKGALLKEGGKAVAQWDGSKWVELE